MLVRIQYAAARLSAWLASLAFLLSSALLVFLSVTLFLQVLFRYVIKQPLPWTEEAARYALVWYAMLAAARAAWSGQHFVFRWATMFLPDTPRRVLKLAASALTLAFLAIMIDVSWAYIPVLDGQTTLATEIDMRIPYAGVPAGLSMVFLLYTLDLVDSVLAFVTGTSFSERHQREAEVERQLARGPLDAPAGGRP